MTKPISIDIPHQLGIEEAKRRIDGGFGDLQAQIAAFRMAEVHKTWDGDVMSFAAKVVGQGLRGQLTVLSDSIRIEIQLPNFLAAVADTIKGRLRRKGQLLLEKK